MTREEALKVLKKELQIIDDPNVTMTAREWEEHDDHMRDALEMAIAALEHDKKEIINTKSVFNLSDDVISRQAAIDAVMGFMPSLTTPDGCGQFDREIFEAQEMFVDIGQALNKLPSAQPFTAEQIQTMQELEFAQVEKAYELGTKEKIIRCMDCKYLQKWRSEESAKKFGQTYECARNVLDCPTLEDFCSHAERRTDE